MELIYTVAGVLLAVRDFHYLREWVDSAKDLLVEQGLVQGALAGAHINFIVTVSSQWNGKFYGCLFCGAERSFRAGTSKLHSAYLS